MKRIFLPLLALGALVACTKDEAPGIPADGRIRITAAIAGASAPAAPAAPAASGTQTPQTRGIVLGSQAQTGLVLLRVDDASDTAPASFAGAAYITADRAADGTLSNFSAPQHYALDDSHAWFTGFHPAGSKGADQTSWTLAAGGKTDILLTDEAWSAGRHTAPVATGMTFGHALALLQVSCTADALHSLGSVQATWGKITKIELLETASTATYTYADRTMAFTGSTALALSKSDCETAFAPVTLDATNQLCAGGMFAPAAGGTAPLKLKVYSEKKPDGVEVSVQLRDGAADKGFEAGKTHTVSLVFDAESVRVAATASTSDWNLNGNTIGQIGTEGPPPTVSLYDYYYSDGTTSPILNAALTVEGIVMWVDPDDASHFKVISIGERASLAWSTSNFDVGIGAYAALRDASADVNSAARVSGKANRELLGQWIADVSVNTTGKTINDFPAFRYCDEMGRDWCLPALSELQYLYCAYNGASPRTWASYVSGAPSDNSTAQASFNALFTAVSKSFTPGEYRSSTESGYSHPWQIHFANGDTRTAAEKNAYNGSIIVRCVKEVNYRSYPYVVGTTVVSKDEFGAAVNIFHDDWTAETMPRHDEKSPYDGVSARMEVALRNCDASNAPGVVWEPKTGTGAGTHVYTWENALKACARYTQPSGAIGTWRQMTRQEFFVVRTLQSKLTANGMGGLTWSDYGWYWFSTEQSNNANNAWRGNTHMGYDNGTAGKSNLCVVRCVRDDVPNPAVTYPYVLDGAIIVSKDGYNQSAGPFHNNWTSATIPTHDETSADNALAAKLQVAKEDCNSTNAPGVVPDYNDSCYYWTNAVAACAAYTQTGTTYEQTAGNWRLPTKAELELIYAQRNELTGIDSFSNLSFPYISATESSANNTRIWTISLTTGFIGRYIKDDAYLVRCVRDI